MTKFDLNSEFIFTSCQVGAEGVLKKEFLRDHPEFRFAFSRPGFVTFKNAKGPVPLDSSIKSVFARTFGVSFGTIDGTQISKVLDLAKSLKDQDPNRKVRLHVWERDLHAPGEEPLGFEVGTLLGDIQSRIFQEAQSDSPTLIEKDPTPGPGDVVIQVMAIDPGKFGLGAFIYSNSHSKWPGGRAVIELPPESPSRAYLKLEEVLQAFQVPVRSGDIAVEIGSAPGGASYSLLKRGVKVVGIDPGEMDQRVLKHPKFTHVKKPVGQVLRESLPSSVQWLLLDMNVEPNISLFAVDRLASRMIDSLLGVILTVKLNKWKIADEIPYMLEHVKAIGMTKVKAAQLSFHRQEIVIYGLTRRGMSSGLSGGPNTNPSIKTTVSK